MHWISDMLQWFGILSTLGGLLWIGGRKAKEIDDHTQYIKDLRDILFTTKEQLLLAEKKLSVCEERTEFLRLLQARPGPNTLNATNQSDLSHSDTQ
ncbi:hypothetical protein [Woodsholea maritima]|uniref:hypothetical protein n=1 Tax=Woodsholea maritima TaxID=240237 RepID=UPI000374436E|nr:hypothetical protein [Woodsholea maritima]